MGSLWSAENRGKVIGHHGTQITGLAGMPASAISGRLKSALEQTHGAVEDLRKIVLLACKGAKFVGAGNSKRGPETDTGKKFNGALLVELCKEFSQANLLLAGYEDFVTICSPEHPIEDPTLRSGKNLGKRAIGVSGTQREDIKLLSEQTTMVKKLHKKVVKWDKDKKNAVAMVELEAWSDKLK